MLGSLIAGLASGEALGALGRMRRAVIVYSICAVLGMLGLGFFLVAAYLSAAKRYGPIEAALFFGGGFVLLALIVLGIHKMTAGVRVRRAAQQRKSDLAKVGIAAAIAVLPSVLRTKPGIGIVVGPALALLAYAIYKENSTPGPESEAD